MDINKEGKYGIKPIRGKSQVYKVKPYSMVDIIGNVQAPVSIAQLLKDLKNQKELRDFMKKTSHVELIEADEEYWLHSEKKEKKTIAVKSNLIINRKKVKTLINSGAAANIIMNKLRKRLGIRIERPSKTIFIIANGKKYHHWEKQR